jgi:hypothetical protein
MEHIMFAFILSWLSAHLSRAERRRRDTYLASSTDLAMLECRIREINASGRRF